MKAQSKPASKKPAARLVRGVPKAMPSKATGYVSGMVQGAMITRTDKPAPRPSIKSRSFAKQWYFFRNLILNERTSDLIEHIRSGIGGKLLVGAAESVGVSREEMFYMVGISTATANRKIAQNLTLDQSVTERLARLAMIEAQAEDTFGDKELANRWLRTENRGLGGKTPLSMLDTGFGEREVVKVLVAIAHGGVA